LCHIINTFRSINQPEIHICVNENNFNIKVNKIQEEINTIEIKEEIIDKIDKLRILVNKSNLLETINRKINAPIIESIKYMDLNGVSFIDDIKEIDKELKRGNKDINYKQIYNEMKDMLSEIKILYCADLV
jgi:hypothetical protein